RRHAAPLPGVKALALPVDIDAEMGELIVPEIGLDRRLALAVEGEVEDDEIAAAECRLEAVERGHLALAGGAPRGPEVDQDHPALEVGEAQRLALAVLEADRRHWLGAVEIAKVAHLALEDRERAVAGGNREAKRAAAAVGGCQDGGECRRQKCREDGPSVASRCHRSTSFSTLPRPPRTACH